MPEDTTREERFSFRFIVTTKETAEHVRNMLPDAAWKVRENEMGFVVVFDIVEGMDLEPLYQGLDDMRLDPHIYSIWVSVTSELDHSGVSVPDYVLTAIRRTNGGVDFSFAACLGAS